MKAFACLVLCILTVACAHPSREPGPFTNQDLLPSSNLDDSCSTAVELNGVKFNLSQLQLSTGGYIANNTIDDMFYCINVCSNVNSERNCVCNPCGGNQYPAEQVKTGDICVASLGLLSTAQWDLIDPKQPKVGVSLTYSGGQTKQPFVRLSGRSTIIYFYCDVDAPQYPVPVFLGADSNEVYRFSFNSSSGCPV